jgi:transposase
MSKCYRPYQPEQPFLLPPSLTDWLPKDHVVFFLSDLVDQLDLSAIEKGYEEELRGRPPFHPRMMVKVLVYAYCSGVFSSRRIERRLQEDVSFRVLAANNLPDFRTICKFRRRHLATFKDLFQQVLVMCADAGLVKLGHVSLDGTKVLANASKHKAMSYVRMRQEEQRLAAEIDDLVAKAEKQDRHEDRVYGNRLGDELPEELAIREKRLAKIRQAKEALEEDQRRKGKHEPPSDSAQRNFTDPDSRIMRTPDKTFEQCYNAQVLVDSKTQVIVAQEITQQAVDVGQLRAMVWAGVENVGRKPRQLAADAGYFSKDNVEFLGRIGIEAFIPPDKVRHGQVSGPSPCGRIPATLGPAERMRRKLSTRRGRKGYKPRKESVEAVLGQIKEAQGFRRFSLRGLEQVKAEWSLVCLAHNLRKLMADLIPKGVRMSTAPA